MVIQHIKDEDGIRHTHQPTTLLDPLPNLDKATLQLTCFNFKKELFVTGHGTPIRIGTAGTDLIYLQFRTLSIAGGNITFLYTFYLSEVADAK